MTLTSTILSQHDSPSGFGTFIDKNLFPYSYQDPTRKANPCYTGQIDLLTGEVIKTSHTYDACRIDCPQL